MGLRGKDCRGRGGGTSGQALSLEGSHYATIAVRSQKLQENEMTWSCFGAEKRDKSVGVRKLAG